MIFVSFESLMDFMRITQFFFCWYNHSLGKKLNPKKLKPENRFIESRDYSNVDLICFYYPILLFGCHAIVILVTKITKIEKPESIKSSKLHRLFIKRFTYTHIHLSIHLGALGMCSKIISVSKWMKWICMSKFQRLNKFQPFSLFAVNDENWWASLKWKWRANKILNSFHIFL